MNKKITLINSTPMRKSRGYFNIFNAAWYIVLLLAVFTAGCKKDTFKGEVKGICPLVVTDPMDKAVDVALPKVITATFNTAMRGATVNSSSFIIKQGTTVIAGTVAATADPKVYTFTPTAPLSPYTVYSGTITTAATDTFRTAMVANYNWTFTTIPQVTVTSSPAGGGTTTGAGVFAQGSVTTVTATPAAGFTFVNWTNSGVVASTSPNYTFTMNGNIALVANFAAIPPGKFAVNLSSLPAAGGTTGGSGLYNAGSSVTVTETPNAGYVFSNWTNNGVIVSSSQSYQFILTGNTTLVANFKLIPASQFALILSSNPAAGGTTSGGGLYNAGTSVTAVATPNAGYTFTNWTNGAAIVSTSPSYTFPLNANTTLVANFSPIVQNAPLFTSIFGAFGGGAGITNQGINTVINNGAIGTTGASTLITGFHDGLTGDVYTETPLNVGLVTGGIFTAPPPPGTAAKFATATQELAKITAFYNSISPANKPGGTDPGAGELGNLTLPPGVYKSAGATFNITTGNLTLDAQGDPNATWIFQTAAGLTVGIAGPAGAKSVILINGAQSRNVYWYVGSAAVINAAGGGVMVGTIISTSGITFSTAGNNVQTVLNGRALSQVASVTMVNTTINVPN